MSNTQGNSSRNHISFNNPTRGYSNRHSTYDNAFNMDFEYSYLDLMSNFGAFVSRTHDIYSNMETCISTIIETQNERRNRVNIRRDRAHRSQRMQQLQEAVANDNDNDNDSHDSHESSSNTDLAPTSEGDATATTPNTRDARESRESEEINNNSRTRTRTRTTTADTTATTPIFGTDRVDTNRFFDVTSVFYTTPRTVLLNPNNPIHNSRHRRSGGLTISQIEENTEIVNYNSILSGDILNTECPITRETFTANSVVLKLKQCKHCFVPFRMMTWLETHSTCPLCRSNVIREETPVTNTNTNTTNSDGDSNINISNILNSLVENNSNDFNNLSIDNVNDNSIMFSFDLPPGSSGESNHSGIFPNLERLITNTLSRNSNNSSAPTLSTAPITAPSTIAPVTADDLQDSNLIYDEYNYPEVD